MRARCGRCCASSWILSGSTTSRRRRWSVGSCLNPLRGSQCTRPSRRCDAPTFGPSSSARHLRPIIAHALMHAQKEHVLTWRRFVLHRTGEAAIFYFLREHFNIHDLDFKMWCDETSFPLVASSYVVRHVSCCACHFVWPRVMVYVQVRRDRPPHLVHREKARHQAPARHPFVGNAGRPL